MYFANYYGGQFCAVHMLGTCKHFVMEEFGISDQKYAVKRFKMSHDHQFDEDLIDFDNVLQNQIVSKLFEPVRLETTSEESLNWVKNNSSPSLVNKTLNEYRLYHDTSSGKDYIISRYESGQQKTYRMTLMHYFVIKKRLEILHFILENYQPNLELRIDFYDSSKKIRNVTILWIATYFENFEMVDLLLKKGANPNVVNQNGSSPLRIATYDSKIEIVRVLLEHNADPNLMNKFNNTPLMVAAYKNYPDIVCLLLSNGADADKAAFCGNTALHFASQSGSINSVSLLLENKATFKRNISGLTPLQVAAWHCKEKLVEYYFTKMKFTLNDHITAYELMAAAFILREEGELLYNTVRYLNKTFLLRSVPLDLHGNDFDPHFLDDFEFSSIDRSIPPKHAKALPPTAQSNQRLVPIQEVETLDEFWNIAANHQRLLYECLLISERFFGRDNLKLAEVLMQVGDRLVRVFGDYLEGLELWRRAIQIKIDRKVFISRDLKQFYDVLKAIKTHERFNPDTINCSGLGPLLLNDNDPNRGFFHYWIDLINFVIQYFEARPLPHGLQPIAFQLNVHDLNQIEHFTLNDVKVENFVPPLIDCECDFHETDDVDQVIKYALYAIYDLSSFFPKMGAEKRQIAKDTIEKLLKLNYPYSKCGRNLIHLIFLDDLNRPLPSVEECLSMLYRCGVNTNVYDYAYNTPLHFLVFYCTKKRLPIRWLAKQLKNLISHVYYGKYIENALYHFDYADINQVHLDAVNVSNQTAFDLNPSLINCVQSQYSCLNLFPLKCLAARAAHSKLLRCGICRYLSMYQSTKVCEEYNRSIHEGLDDICVEMKRLNIHIEAEHTYRLKRNYVDHQPKFYDAKSIWKIIKQYSQQYKINVKLLEFIEMHGPCKFAHLVEQSTD